MKFVFRILIAIVVVCALVIGWWGVRALVPSPSAAGTDRNALVALYQATNGANWTNSDNWLTDTPIGRWHGVVSFNDGNVIGLVLSENGLEGTIPPEIGNLTNLDLLDLSGNELSGTIPPELSNLVNLRVLYLSGNALSGEIPSELSKLTGLTRVSLSYNQLSGSIPPELGDLVNLRDLYLSDNRLGGRIPSELGNLTNLIRLDFSGNQLSGEIPSELVNLTNLEALDLTENRLSGLIPSQLGQLTNLLGLDLSENQLSGAIPSELGNANLIYLGVSENKLSGEIPSELVNLTNLEVLDLSRNELSGTIPTQLGNLPSLRKLSLSGNQLTGCVSEAWRNVEANDLDELGLPFCVVSSTTDTSEAGITDREVWVALYRATDGDNWLNNENWLTNAPIDSWHGVTTDSSGRVIELNLSFNQLNGTIPLELGKLTFLEVLGLYGNRLSGTIPSELGKLTNLKGLYLWNNELNGSIPSALGNLVNLTVLRLSDNELSGTIPSELGNLTNLTWLDLGGNELSGPIPPKLGHLANLTMLDFGGNRLSGTMPLELGNLTSLERLSLSKNQLSGTIPLELGNLTNLESLTLSENQLRGTIPSELGKLTKLGWLLLSDNELSGSIPKELGNLTKLMQLYLSENQLSGSIPSELGKLTNLNWLRLSGNRLSGCVPKAWRNVAVGVGGESDLDELGLPFCVASSTTDTTTTGITDRDALVALYQATDGANWVNNDNWLTDAPLDAWYGVTKFDDRGVIGLTLSENGLRGTIPPELGGLTNLDLLKLGGNELRGTIPSALGNLTSLGWLELWGNELSGPIPSELSNLSNLVVMDLSWNQLSGPIPSEFGKLSNLTALDLSANELRGTIPSELGNTNLRQLSLAKNQLSGTIPSELGNTKLRWLLDLSENQLSGTIPPRLGVLTDLIELNLGDNQLSGTIPPQLGKLTYLTELYLWGNELSGAMPPELGNLTNLKEMNLYSNQLSGSIPSELGNLTYLEGLTLSDNKLRGTIPPELGTLIYLEVLSLWGNELRGTIPSELGTLTNLTRLALSDNRLSGSIPPELGSLTNLEGLTLWGNQLSGMIPLELGNLTNLGLLHLSGNQLSGCVPAVWRNAEESDLDELGLPFCVASASTTAVPERLTSAQIFAKVSPAIAFIQSPTGTGSGVLIEGGYLVTNAHVVWPFDTARVVFPGGTVFHRVPVRGWDLLADLAVLGPIDAPAQPATLRAGESIPIGSETYLIGYPGEFEALPQPTMVRGILSRLREWEPVRITYFQTDAIAIGGQSGGALVSAAGDVIGISGFRITEGKFALSASSADLLPRIRQLIAGEDPSGLGERQLPLEGGALYHELTLQRNLGNVYIINEPAGAAIDIELSGADDARIRLYNPFGDELADAETDSLSFVTERNGPHFLLVSQDAEEFTLTANRRLARFDDPDHAGQIQVGQSLHGNIDFPTDFDTFLLHLQESETVEIVARSALVDTYLAIGGHPVEGWTEDDDGGGGLFGLDARIVYRASTTGEYILFVSAADGSAPGGYIISVDLPQATDTPSSLVPVVTVNNQMNVREGPGTNYPIIGTAAPGEQYVITGKSPGLGDWWRIIYKGRTGWVYGPLVTATNAQNVPAVAAPVP